MSYWEAKKKLEELSSRDRLLYEAHRRACNAQGFATQMAEQGAGRSQEKYERRADEAEAEFWRILTEMSAEGISPDLCSNSSRKAEEGNQ